MWGEELCGCSILKEEMEAGCPFRRGLHGRVGDKGGGIIVIAIGVVVIAVECGCECIRRRKGDYAISVINRVNAEALLLYGGGRDRFAAETLAGARDGIAGGWRRLLLERGIVVAVGICGRRASGRLWLAGRGKWVWKRVLDRDAVFRLVFGR
jgi:hypothetical protein